jgi:hypothetical protein
LILVFRRSIYIRISTSYTKELNYWLSRQNGVADDRVLRVTGWLRERLSDTAMLADQDSIKDGMAGFFRSGSGADAGIVSQLVETLDQYPAHYDYMAALIIGRDKGVIAASSDSAQMGDSRRRAIGEQVTREPERRIHIAGSSPANALLIFTAPI